MATCDTLEAALPQRLPTDDRSHRILYARPQGVKTACDPLPVLSLARARPLPAAHAPAPAPARRYGGVVLRKNIAEKADWYVMDIQQVIDALKQQQ